MSSDLPDPDKTRQERRDVRRLKRQEMRKHGANLATLYRNAVIRRAAAPPKRSKGHR